LGTKGGGRGWAEEGRTFVMEENQEKGAKEDRGGGGIWKLRGKLSDSETTKETLKKGSTEFKKDGGGIFEGSKRCQSGREGKESMRCI